MLITDTTYPLPSRSYDELVCTAGILENGDWIRIYPIPLSFLFDLKNSNKLEQVKYRWIELDLVKRKDDFRPESHSPKHYDFRDIVVHNSIGTERNWAERKSLCCQKVYTDLGQLIEESKAPTNVSLATFRPTKIRRLVIEKDSREWKDEWKELRMNGDLFSDGADPETMIRKLPYKFSYEFEDDKGKRSTLMIEDWEIGALYWKCLKNANDDETEALMKVRQRYEKEFLTKKDIYLFLGTTKEWHMRRGSNPFVIIGVMYPKRETQLQLF